MKLRVGALLAILAGCGGEARVDGGADASTELDAGIPGDAGHDAGYGCPTAFECPAGLRCSESTHRCVACDEDGDGYEAPECADVDVDCDDEDDSVHPAAPTVCANGVFDACEPGLDEAIRTVLGIEEGMLVERTTVHTVPPGWTLVPEISFALTEARAWLAVANHDGVRTHGAVSLIMLATRIIEGHFIVDGLVRAPFHPSSMAIRTADSPESVWFVAVGDAPDFGYDYLEGVLEEGGTFDLSSVPPIDGNPSIGRAAIVGGGARADGSRVEPIGVHRTQYVGRWHHTNWRIEDGRILYSTTYSPFETDGFAWMHSASSSGAHAVFQSDGPLSRLVIWDTLGVSDDVALIDVTFPALPASASLGYLGGERYALSYAVDPYGVAVVEVTCAPACTASAPRLVEPSRPYLDTSLAELPSGMALAAADAASGQVFLWLLSSALETVGAERVIGTVDPVRSLGDLSLASGRNADQLDLFVAASELGAGAQVWISGVRGCLRR